MSVHRKLVAGLLAALALLALAPAVSAAAGSTPGTPSFDQAWLILIGGLVPLATYILNHYAPWVSEQAKGIVFVIVAAVAGGLYAAVQNGNFGWNGPTAQLVVTSVFAALMAHHWLWKPSGIAGRFGAGTNAT